MANKKIDIYKTCYPTSVIAILGGELVSPDKSVLADRPQLEISRCYVSTHTI
jgi:hypothetical protein